MEGKERIVDVDSPKYGGYANAAAVPCFYAVEYERSDVLERKRWQSVPFWLAE